MALPASPVIGVIPVILDIRATRATPENQAQKVRWALREPREEPVLQVLLDGQALDQQVILVERVIPVLLEALALQVIAVR